MTDLDISTAIRQLYDEYGEDAGEMALSHAKEALIAGDDEGKDTWIRILKGICDLQAAA